MMKSLFFLRIQTTIPCDIDSYGLTDFRLECASKIVSCKHSVKWNTRSSSYRYFNLYDSSSNLCYFYFISYWCDCPVETQNYKAPFFCLHCQFILGQ